MVLTFVGRKHEDVYSGHLNQLFGLLARSLQSLVAKVRKIGTRVKLVYLSCVCVGGGG